METTTFQLPYCYKLNTKFMKLLLFLENNFINYTIADNTITIVTGSAIESFTVYYLFQNYK